MHDGSIVCCNLPFGVVDAHLAFRSNAVDSAVIELRSKAGYRHGSARPIAIRIGKAHAEKHRREFFARSRSSSAPVSRMTIDTGDVIVHGA